MDGGVIVPQNCDFVNRFLLLLTSAPASAPALVLVSVTSPALSPLPSVIPFLFAAQKGVAQTGPLKGKVILPTSCIPWVFPLHSGLIWLKTTATLSSALAR